MSRILTALVAVPVLLAILLAGPVWMFLLLAVSCALVGYWELGAMARHVGWAPSPLGYPLVALFVAAFHPDFLAFEDAALAMVLLVGLHVVLTRGPGLDAVGSLGIAVLGALYVGALFGSIVGLRLIEPERVGRLSVVFLLAVVMIGDAGAFFVGRSVGRRALAPVLSPKKTIEGLVGGVVFSVAASVLLRSATLPRLSLSAAVGLGLAMALLGVAGDLFESLLKRSFGVKDSSSLFPGHGGMLDRVDSVLFAAPLLYLYLKWS